MTYIWTDTPLSQWAYFSFNDFYLWRNKSNGKKNMILEWNPLVAFSEAWIITTAWYFERLSDIKDDTWNPL